MTLPEGATPEHDPYAALRNPAYRMYVLSGFVIFLGGQSQALALLAYANDHGSFTAVRNMALASLVPMLLFTLPAGQVADRFNRRNVILAMHGIAILSAAGLAYVTRIDGPIEHVYLLVVVRSTAMTFARPARQALLPQIVPALHFSNAMNWNTTTFRIACIAGPVMGGTLAAVSPDLPYMVDVVCLAYSLLFTFYIRVPPSVTPAQPITAQNLVSGVQFVWKTKLILSALTLDLFAVLLGGAVALLPYYADNILHVGKHGLGWLRAAPEAGALLMALLMTHLPPLKRAGPALLWSVAGFGAATIVFGFSRNFALSLFMLFLTGAFDSVSVVVRHTLVQLLSPDEMRGRVSAVNGMFIGISNELGEAESAQVAKWFGPVFSAVSGGIGTICAVGAIAMLWPQLRQLRSLQDIRPARVASDG